MNNNENNEMSSYAYQTYYPIHVVFNQYFFKDGVKIEQNWNMFEKNTIFQTLQQYYATSAPFKNVMDTEFNSVIITAPFHDNGDGAGEHFQCMFINDKNIASKPRDGYKTGKLHGTFKTTSMGVVTINKITAITSY